MNVTLLGTGTPTNPHRFQSGVVIEIGNATLLFDAGRGTVHQLYQAGINVAQVNPVFITHHHFDHINDLFDVIISTAMLGRTTPLQIYGPPGTKRIVHALVEQVYAADIRFRLEEDRQLRAAGGRWDEQPEAIARLDVKEVLSGHVADEIGWQILAEPVLHGSFPNAPDFEWHCLGYRIEAEGKIVTISGDTVPCEGITRLSQDADLLVQCCHLPASKANTPAMRYLTQSILPSSRQVGKIAASANVKRMVLTHLSASIHQQIHTEIEADIREDFDGDLIIGQDLMVLTI